MPSGQNSGFTACKYSLVRGASLPLDRLKRGCGTLSDSKLCNVTILAIEQERVHSLPVDAVVDAFAVLLLIKTGALHSCKMSREKACSLVCLVLW